MQIIADAVVLGSLTYVERGMRAEKKLMELEAEHANQNYEMNKAAKKAQDLAARQQQRNGKRNSRSNATGGSQKHHNIQQPKRD